MKSLKEFEQFIKDSVLIAKHVNDINYMAGTERIIINVKAVNNLANNIRTHNFLQNRYGGKNAD